MPVAKPKLINPLDYLKNPEPQVNYGVQNTGTVPPPSAGQVPVKPPVAVKVKGVTTRVPAESIFAPVGKKALTLDEQNKQKQLESFNREAQAQEAGTLAAQEDVDKRAVLTADKEADRALRHQERQKIRALGPWTGSAGWAAEDNNINREAEKQDAFNKNIAYQRAYETYKFKNPLPGDVEEEKFELFKKPEDPQIKKQKDLTTAIANGVYLENLKVENPGLYQDYISKQVHYSERSKNVNLSEEAKKLDKEILDKENLNFDIKALNFSAQALKLNINDNTSFLDKNGYPEYKAISEETNVLVEEQKKMEEQYKLIPKGSQEEKLFIDSYNELVNKINGNVSAVQAIEGNPGFTQALEDISKQGSDFDKIAARAKTIVEEKYPEIYKIQQADEVQKQRLDDIDAGRIDAPWTEDLSNNLINPIAKAVADIPSSFAYLPVAISNMFSDEYGAADRIYDKINNENEKYKALNPDAGHYEYANGKKTFVTNMLPEVVGVGTNMGVMIVESLLGVRALSLLSGAEKTTAMYRVATVATGYVQAAHGFYDAGIEAGMTRDEANAYAQVQAWPSALLELINPEAAFLSKSSKVAKRSAAEYMRILKKGGPDALSLAREGAQKVVMNIAGENIQELSQLTSELGVNHLTNKVLGTNLEVTEDLEKKIKHTVGVTTIVSGVVGIGGAALGVSASKNQLLNDAIYDAATNPNDYKKLIIEQTQEGKLFEKDAANVAYIVNTAETAMSRIGNIDEASKRGTLPYMMEKINLEGQKKNLDKIYHPEIDKKIAELDKAMLVISKTKSDEVAQLRADEQEELKSSIPNIEDYKVDGNVDRNKITDEKVLKKFDKIYDKYDKLISPLLPAKPTQEVKGDEVGSGVGGDMAKSKVIEDVSLEVIDFENESENIDTYEASDKAEQIAKDNGVNILRGKDLRTVAVDKNGETVGGLWTEVNGNDFSFDVAVDKKMQGKGVGEKLVNEAIAEFNNNNIEGNLKYNIDVTNPSMEKLLLKYGFKVVERISGHTLMEHPTNNPKFKEQSLPTQEAKGKAEEVSQEPTEADVVKTPILKRINKAFLKIGTTIFDNAEQLISKAKEILGEGKQPRFSITMPDGSKKTVQPVNADVVNGFYSPLEKIINESKSDKLPAKHWAEKPFAKGEEARVTGLADWLSQQQDSVSKTDIQQYLKDNRVSVVEVVKEGEISEEEIDTLLEDEVGQDMTRGDAREFLENDERQDDTKFSEYQLEGEKENYKEVLVTMPQKDIYTIEKWKDGGYVLRVNGGNYAFNESVEYLKKEQAKLESGQNKHLGHKFKSSHFEEPNILVHLRMNTRTDAQGNKVLFLEEVQSDWGQKGKKEGFAQTVDEKRIEELGNLIDKQNKIREESQDEKTRLDAIENRTPLVEELKKLREKQKGIPTAPFVMDTNAWIKLGLKVALKEAVKQGADKIAWSTGTQQFERWGSEEIKWEKNNDKVKIENGKIIINGKETGTIKKSKSEGDYIVEDNKTGERYVVKSEDEILNKGRGFNLLINEQTTGAIAFNGRVTGNRDNLNIQTKADLRSAINKNLKRERNDAEIDKLTDRIWNRMQTEDSGTSLPRKEGMEEFYGNPANMERAKNFIIKKEGELFAVKDEKGKTIRTFKQENEAIKFKENYGLGIVGNVAKSLFKQEPKTTEVDISSATERKSYEIEETEEGFYVFDTTKGIKIQLNSMKPPFKTYDSAVKWAKENAIVNKPSTQHSIDITPELKAQVEQGQPLFHYNDKGEILGFTHEGKIYLNGEKITAGTTMEEAGHIWTNWAKEKRPDLYKAGLDKVNGSSYLKEVEANKNYQEDALKLGKKGSKEYNQYMKEEALAKAIADNGAKFVTESKRADFKGWVRAMWRAVIKEFGIKDATPEQISKMPLEEFAKKAAADIFTKDSNVGDQAKANIVAKEGETLTKKTTDELPAPSKEEREVDDAIENAKRSLASTGIEIVTDPKQVREAMEKDGQKSSHGLFVAKDGKIYLDREKFQKGFGRSTVWHEAAHPVINILRNTNRPLYDKVVAGLKKIRGNEGVDNVIEWAQENYKKERWDDESVVESIAAVGDGRIDPNTLPKSFRQTLINAVNEFAKMLGFDQVLDDTDIGAFKKLAAKVSGALKTGKDISSIVGKDNVKKFEYTDSKGNVIKDSQFNIQSNYSDRQSGITFEYTKYEATFKKLKDAGFITEDKQLADFKGMSMAAHSPDAMFTGTISKNGNIMVKGKGGIFYPIKFHKDGYFWASTKDGASSLAKLLNESAKENNNGKVLMALISAPQDKLLSSTTSANAVIDIFLSKALDKKFGIDETKVKKAIIRAATKTTKVKGKKVGLKMNNLNDNMSTDEIVSKVRERLAAEKSIFPDRKLFSEDVIKGVVKGLNKKQTQALGEFFYKGLDQEEMMQQGGELGMDKENAYKLSVKNVRLSISYMLSEPLLRETETNKVYAVIEMDVKNPRVEKDPKTGESTKVYVEPVVAEGPDDHESYPRAIKSTDQNSKVTVHILQDRSDFNTSFVDPETGGEITKERKKKVFPTYGVSTTTLKVSENLEKSQASTGERKGGVEEDVAEGYRGIQGQYSEDYNGVQYFSVNEKYAKVFGKNIIKANIAKNKILDLEKWNKRLRELGLKGGMFGQGILTIDKSLFDENKKFTTEGWKPTAMRVKMTLGVAEFNEFVKEFNNADVIYGEDIGNKGEFVYAVKNNEAINPKQKESQASTGERKQSLPKAVAGVTYTELSKKRQDSLREDRSKKEYFDDEVTAMKKSKLSDEELKRIVKDEDFGILTGQNPDNTPTKDDVNEKLNKKAEEWISEKGYTHHKVTGRYNQTENSFLVPGLTADHAVEFAKEFNQESVVTNEGLIYQDGTMNPREKESDSFDVDVSLPDANYASAVRTKDGSVKGFSVGIDFDGPKKKSSANKPNESQASKGERKKTEPETREERVKKINDRFDQAEQNTIEALRSLKLGLVTPEGSNVTKQGMDLEDLIKVAFTVARQAVIIGGDIKVAIEKTLKTLRDTKAYQGMVTIGSAQDISIGDRITDEVNNISTELSNPKIHAGAKKVLADEFVNQEIKDGLIAEGIEYRPKTVKMQSGDAKKFIEFFESQGKLEELEELIYDDNSGLTSTTRVNIATELLGRYSSKAMAIREYMELLDKNSQEYISLSKESNDLFRKAGAMFSLANTRIGSEAGRALQAQKELYKMLAADRVDEVVNIIRMDAEATIDKIVEANKKKIAKSVKQINDLWDQGLRGDSLKRAIKRVIKKNLLKSDIEGVEGLVDQLYDKLSGKGSISATELSNRYRTVLQKAIISDEAIEGIAKHMEVVKLREEQKKRVDEMIGYYRSDLEQASRTGVPLTKSEIAYHNRTIFKEWKALEKLDLKAQEAIEKASKPFKDPRDFYKTLTGILKMRLLSPLSLFKNISGYLPYVFIHPVLKVPSSVMDWAYTNTTNLFRGDKVSRSQNFLLDSIGYKTYGSPFAFREAVRRFWTGKTNPNIAELDTTSGLNSVTAWKDIFRHRRAGERGYVENKISAILEAISPDADMISRLLAAPDVLVRKTAERGAVFSMAKNQNLSGPDLWDAIINPPKEVKEVAEEIGARAAYQNKNEAAKLLDDIGNKTDSKYIGRHIKSLAKFLLKEPNIPFVTTPINIVSAGIKLTMWPVSLAAAVWNIKKSHTEQEEGNKVKSAYYRGRAIESFSMMGFALAAGSFALEMLLGGALTGAADKEDKDIKSESYQHKHPNSLNYSAVLRKFAGNKDWSTPALNSKGENTDTWIHLAGLGPIGVAFSVHANVYQSMDVSERNNTSLSWNTLSGIEAIPAAVRSALDQTYLAGAHNLMDAIFSQDPKGTFMTNYLKTISTTFLPNTLSAMSRSSSEYMRDTKGGSVGDRFKAGLKERLFMGDELPTKVTVWGSPVSSLPPGTNKYAYYFLDPFQSYNVNTQSFKYLLFDFYNNTGIKTIIPTAPENKIVINKEPIELSPKEYEEYQTIVGKMREAETEKYVLAGDFKTDDQDKRVATLNRIYDGTKEQAKRTFIMNNERLLLLSGGMESSDPREMLRNMRSGGEMDKIREDINKMKSGGSSDALREMIDNIKR